MSKTVHVTAEHPLFSDDPAQLHIVHGRAGVGKSIFLTHLALAFLQRGARVLHLACTATQHLKNMYQSLNPKKSDWSLRLLHTRSQPFSADDVERIIARYQTLLGFGADLIIIENDAFWIRWLFNKTLSGKSYVS